MRTFWSSMAKRATPYVPGEQPNDQDVLKLNTNENPYPPSPAVTSAITKELGKDLRLYPPPNADDLKEVIAATYDVAKENVFVGNGSDEVLAFSFMAFFEPGHTIRFPNITYSFYPVYANLFNIPYEEIPVNHDFTLKANAFYHSEGGVIFPNPNAPTSLSLPLDEVRKIVENNPENVVIVDEAYVDFAQQSAVQLIRDYPNLLVVQTTSKSRSLAGLRVGYAFGDDQLIRALTRMKDSFNSYTLDRLALAGAIESFRDSVYTEKTIQKIIRTRTWLTKEMTELGFHVLPSDTNFIFVSHKKHPANRLYDQLKAKQILVRYFNNDPIDQYLRITIGTDEEMKRFLNAIKQIMYESNTDESL